jgi:molybdate transport system regulatory protein
VEDLNRHLGTAVVATAAGGSGGGGARLTPAGQAIVTEYRAIEKATAVAVESHLANLTRHFDVP